MKLGRALMIFSDIENDGFSEREKALAIHTILQRPTHNAVSKDKMISVINWLWNQSYEIEAPEEVKQDAVD